MTSDEETLKLINSLAFENGRMRFLIGEAITYMCHAEKFIESREKMHPTGVQQWGELIDRLREVLDDSNRADEAFEREVFGNESAKLVGGV